MIEYLKGPHLLHQSWASWQIMIDGVGFLLIPISLHLLIWSQVIDHLIKEGHTSAIQDVNEIF